MKILRSYHFVLHEFNIKAITIIVGRAFDIISTYISMCNTLFYRIFECVSLLKIIEHTTPFLRCEECVTSLIIAYMGESHIIQIERNGCSH